MSRRTSLRQFQQYLIDRLSTLAHGEGASSLLCIQVGESRWLLNLSESGEIVTLPPLTSVPLTQPSFAGLANIRGNLFAVTDFAAFLGEGATPLNTPGARLLLVGLKQGNNAALLVPRILGLKNPADLEPGPHPADAPDWNPATLVDAAGQKWRQLDLKRLLSDTQFMNIAA
ncbi:MAG: chemotaxis protein CheW [Zoogloeaceae bacterium]|jgi:twitching motility protein PilI|nr:chemotaxis protein CheW [Zoogloeaceae bacterium]